MEKILVIGMGRSGVAVARLAHLHGYEVFVQDDLPREKLNPEYIRLLESVHARWIQSPQEMGKEEQLTVVISPGVPVQQARLDALRKFSFQSEIEFAWKWMKGESIVLTGSNGKSTTVALMEHFLNVAGFPAIACGNFGIPLAEILLDSGYDGHVKVIELSSFQLESTRGIEPDAAVLLAVTENHLNRYRNFEEYRRAKWNLFTQNCSRSHWIVHETEAEAGEFFKFHTLLTTVSDQLNTQGKMKLAATKDGIEGILPLSFDWNQTMLFRKHDRQNCLFALSAVCYLKEISPALLEKGMISYNALHFRQEILKGYALTVINDSKSTSPDATLKALEAFPGTSILILGGRNKGSSFDDLKKSVGKDIKIIAYGESRDFFEQKFSDKFLFKKTGTLEEAVKEAAQWIENEKNLIFSPACESFDQFNGYKDRGEQFNKCVEKYIKHEGENK